MWCILGLGNPGERFQSTRHNAGFDLIDRLSSRWNIPVTLQGPSFWFGSGDWRDTPVLLVKPMTFMNRSGQAYSRLLKDPDITREKTLVLLDDFSLPLGKIRIRKRGSDGGHNGLRSILEAAGTEEIARLRLGLGGADEDWVEFVLQPFTSKERDVMEEALDRAAQAVETIITDDIDKAMNLFNR
ncbi:MAG: aminoacyl-tRNA hydrolase [bacterium]